MCSVPAVLTKLAAESKEYISIAKLCEKSPNAEFFLVHIWTLFAQC